MINYSYPCFINATINPSLGSGCASCLFLNRTAHIRSSLEFRTFLLWRPSLGQRGLIFHEEFLGRSKQSQRSVYEQLVNISTDDEFGLLIKVSANCLLLSLGLAAPQTKLRKYLYRIASKLIKLQGSTNFLNRNVSSTSSLSPLMPVMVGSFISTSIVPRLHPRLSSAATRFKGLSSRSP